MRILIHILIFLSFTLIWTSCRKDEDLITDVNTDIPGPIVNIESSFNGLVKDQDGNGIEGAYVFINGAYVTTDENGYYFIKDEVNKNGTYIRVSYENHYDAYANVLPSLNGISFVNFQLLPRTKSGTLDAQKGGTINVGQNQIQFAPNSFVNKNGETFTGDVDVYINYLDPSIEEFDEIMPGDLAGVSLANEAVILESYGMLNVELQSSTGEKLNINDAATLSFFIPPSLRSVATDEIPLWYFNTDTGVWVEEGQATRVGNLYVGDVTHFTLWNCDAPFELINLTGEVVATNSVPNVNVRVTSTMSGVSRTTKTDSNGDFQGKIPKNQEMLIEVIDQCDNIIANFTLSPQVVDIFVTLNVNTNNYNELIVSGNILDCNNNAVSNGYATIQLESGTSAVARANSTGNFTTTLINCHNDQNLSVRVVDVDGSFQSEDKGFSFSGNSLNTGSIKACDNQLVYEFYADLGDTTIVMPVLSAVDSSSTTFPKYFIFELEDDFGGGNLVRYTLQMIDWAGSPNSIWGMAYEQNIFGSPDNTWDFALDIQNAAITETLDYIELIIPGTTMTRTESNGNTETYTVNSATLRGQK